MANIRDISAHCKVSIATVSKALNGYSDVSDATRERVLAAARELGYFPNAQARSLKTSRKFHLGVIFIDDLHNGITHLFFSHILNSFKNEAERCGYHITFITQKLGNKSLSMVQSCRHIGVEGVCLACINFEDPDVQELAASGIPLVSIDYLFESSPAILSANRDGIGQLVRYIWQQGHRRIAYIHGSPSRVTNERLASFIETMNDLGLPVNPDYLMESPYTDTESARIATGRMLNRVERPTCILLPDDVCAFGAIEAIKAAGLSYPEDVSLAAYDGIILSRWMTPRLTTIYQDSDTIGCEAAKALIYNIEHPRNTQAVMKVIPGQLQIGGSVLRLDN